MSNQDKLINWWWSLDGPRDGGHLSVREIETILKEAKEAKIVQGRGGKTITKPGWNFAVLKFLIENCIISSDIMKKLIGFADSKKGRYAGWRDFEDCSVEVRPTSATLHVTRLSSRAQVLDNNYLSQDKKLRDVQDHGSLSGLITFLQNAIVQGGIGYKVLEQALAYLTALGYQYDLDLFPELKKTENYRDSVGESPANLAEALLWKLGKWKSYKKFAAYYADNNLEPTQTDVVFYSFARHLKDRKNPIYDQHAIRALWAICRNFSEAEKSSCRSLLFDRHDKWKQVGSGSETIKCYKIFVRYVTPLMIGKPKPSLDELDRLLMPLGQAIKKATGTYTEFQKLCGWPING